MSRLFLALWPDERVRRELADWRDAWTWPAQATPVADAKLHLTLHFLGEVGDTQAQALMDAAPTGFAPFAVDLGEPAIWHGGIAVLEPVSPPRALFELQAALGRQLERLGFALEQRPFRPHVTMARRAAAALFPPARKLTWKADEFALVCSRDGVYTPLKRFRCSGAD